MCSRCVCRVPDTCPRPESVRSQHVPTSRAVHPARCRDTVRRGALAHAAHMLGAIGSPCVAVRHLRRLSSPVAPSESEQVRTARVWCGWGIVLTPAYPPLAAALRTLCQQHGPQAGGVVRHGHFVGPRPQHVLTCAVPTVSMVPTGVHAPAARLDAQDGRQAHVQPPVLVALLPRVRLPTIRAVRGPCAPFFDSCGRPYAPQHGYNLLWRHVFCGTTCSRAERKLEPTAGAWVAGRTACHARVRAQCDTTCGGPHSCKRGSARR